ncbi:SDR family oxidoreductase [Nocardia miyunensis]|uniref:SDR family oxidoreductase n=1 Tax=Nocardia miyunensis TaxID=282684 RepID=UPI00082EE45B|nr:SDR family oxidoreductase [Nocardia miyunensis]
MSTSAGTALVVGGSGALGSAIITLLRDIGLSVVATSTTGTEPGTDGTRWVRFDARDGEAGAAGLARAVEQTGEPVRVLVYAAGAASSKSRLAETTSAECVELLTINAAGLHAVWRAVHPAARSGAARVVVISSQAALTCTPGNGPYSASKAALEAVAVTLAKEEAEHGVRVNVLSPSLIASPQAEHLLALKGETDIDRYYRSLPWGRALTLAEVAQLAVSIVCDPAWGYASGQIVRLGADIPTPRGNP